jgi:hypothetical protein
MVARTHLQRALRLCLTVVLLLTIIGAPADAKPHDKKKSKKPQKLQFNKFCTNETTDACFAYATFEPPPTGSSCFWTRLEVRCSDDASGSKAIPVDPAVT